MTSRFWVERKATVEITFSREVDILRRYMASLMKREPIWRRVRHTTLQQGAKTHPLAVARRTAASKGTPYTSTCR